MARLFSSSASVSQPFGPAGLGTVAPTGIRSVRRSPTCALPSAIRSPMAHRTPSVEEYLLGELSELEDSKLYRDPLDAGAREAAMSAARLLGLPFLDCTSNDYLGLAASGVSRETLMEFEGMRAGSGASRLIQGTFRTHLDLEAELADWVRQPAALIFSSGYAANVGLLSSLGKRGGLIVSDSLNHASIIDGCRLSKAEVRIVPHGDLPAVERALAEGRHLTPRWVVTESYFSMDGDRADLRGLRSACDLHHAGLIVDEAHALGVFGPEGAGCGPDVGVRADAVVGTLGKAVGVHGAFVAGSVALRALLWNRARSAVFSTAPSPLLSALTLDHVRRARDGGGLRVALHAACGKLRRALKDAGCTVLAGSEGPIVPLILGGNADALTAAERLRSEGVLAQAIRPPTVPEGTARIRLTVQAGLSDADVERIAGVVKRACAAS